MTEQEQRIAIAEACGWTDIHEDGGGIVTLGRSPEGQRDWCVPDYLNDLNSLMKAVMTLDRDENIIPEENGFETRMDRYIWMLELVVEVTVAEDDIYEACINATAAQRAEAFLHAIGKWEEPK